MINSRGWLQCQKWTFGESSVDKFRLTWKPEASAPKTCVSSEPGEREAASPAQTRWRGSEASCPTWSSVCPRASPLPSDRDQHPARAPAGRAALQHLCLDGGRRGGDQLRSLTGWWWEGGGLRGGGQGGAGRLSRTERRNETKTERSDEEEEEEEEESEGKVQFLAASCRLSGQTGAHCGVQEERTASELLLLLIFISLRVILQISHHPQQPPFFLSTLSLNEPTSNKL